MSTTVPPDLPDWLLSAVVSDPSTSWSLRGAAAAELDRRAGVHLVEGQSGAKVRRPRRPWKLRGGW